MSTSTKTAKAPEPDPPLTIPDQKALFAWLKKHHAKSPGIWLRIAKKGADAPSVNYMEAIEAALCYGWIDGKKMALDEFWWLQRFTPRTAKSIWSKINRDKALALIENGKMQAAGLAEVERAKTDGRWDAAYDGASTATVPPDFQAALEARPKALAFFLTLTGSNRYAFLFRIHNAKMAATRARRIAEFVAMLDKGEKIFP